MKAPEAQKVLDAVIKQIAGFDNKLTLEQFRQKFAYDIRLPVEVHDATTGESTWTVTMNAGKYMTLKNVQTRGGVDDWALAKRPIQSVNDILSAWNEVNYATTERLIDSLNVSESDTIYFCQNVYRSQDIRKSKNVIYCDGGEGNEYVVACQRSGGLTYCIRTEDSGECSNSFSVVWSNNIVNSLFIQDSSNLYECMFCSKLKDKKYCIANMQFEKEEYFRLKKMVLEWLFSPS
ncbi:MAG TPA: hypothetical protein VLE99_04430 [Candidatus Saccharimonadales bacterium]|nr:hypothetical protein [Candidatus Saccharimonadales bacterium]